MKPIIEVNNIGKKYTIGDRERYVALRDVLAGMIKHPLKWLTNKALGGPQQDFWALKNVSFNIERGDVVGVIGGNGAGKSTLLKIFSQITPPSEGSVTLRGTVGSLLEVGTGFHPELTGRENIFLNGAILGMRRKEIENKFDQIVAFSGIDQFLDTPVKRYSSGMYVRLAFSVAAHLEPDILIVDEVLAVGDTEFQKKSLGKMEEISHTDGRTVLFVSHNLDSIKKLCNKIVLMEKGKVKRVGTDVEAIIEEYIGSGGDRGNVVEWKKETASEYTHPKFTPISVSLKDSEGKLISNPVDRKEDVWIEVTADIKEIDKDLIFGYVLYDDHGVANMWSLQTDVKKEEWPEIKLGLNTFRSKLPMSSLNEGSFKVELIAGLYYREWFIRPSGGRIVLDLKTQGSLSESPFWVSKRAGSLALVLPWEERK